MFGARRIPAADHVDVAGRVYANFCHVPDFVTRLDLGLSNSQTGSAVVRRDPAEHRGPHWLRE
jgi:uncharacterized RmlC-like cupin family protein